MDNIKDIIKPPENDSPEVQEFKDKISKMSRVEQDSYFYNLAEGNLNDEDGINCPICKNKGTISFVENGYEKVRNCECMAKRKLYHRFIATGICKDQFRKYKLSNYEITKEWQRISLERAKNYINDIINNKQAYWFYIGGISGSGKTHLCTGIITFLVNANYDVKYFVWNTEISNLISLKKSFSPEGQEEYRKKINELKTCQVLYIDDFLQLDNNIDESMSIAYEIINSRYTNDSLITIISSEIDQDNLYKKSRAVSGRIIEKANKGFYVITVDGEDNNYRKEGN